MAIPPAPSQERNLAFWAQYLDDPGAALRNLWEELGPAFRVQTTMRPKPGIWMTVSAAT